MIYKWIRKIVLNIRLKKFERELNKVYKETTKLKIERLKKQNDESLDRIQEKVKWLFGKENNRNKIEITDQVKVLIGLDINEDKITLTEIKGK